MRVCLIGYGKLGSSIAKGARNAGVEVKVCTLPPTDEWAKRDGFEVVRMEYCIKSGDLVVVAVPPSAVSAVLSKLDDVEKPVVSTAALYKLEEMKRYVKYPYRIMPSVTVEVNKSPILVAEKGGPHDRLVEEFLSKLGTVHWVKERVLDAALPVVGSGPAVHALYYTALVESLVYAGVDRELASKLVRESIEGTIEMLNKYDPYELRSKVETPGGITVDMTTKLEAEGVFGTLARTLGKKGKELSR